MKPIMLLPLLALFSSCDPGTGYQRKMRNNTNRVIKVERKKMSEIEELMSIRNHYATQLSQLIESGRNDKYTRATFADLTKKIKYIQNRINDFWDNSFKRIL